MSSRAEGTPGSTNAASPPLSNNATSAPHEYFDPAEFETRAWLEDVHYWHLARREVILDALQRYAESTTNLLDVGCGVGTVATFLNQHGYHVDYADVHPEALSAARARADAHGGEALADRRFLRLDIFRDPIPEGYGGLLLLDVIEHLPDDVAALNSARAALSPGGLLVVTVPAFNFLWSPYDDVERHKRRYRRPVLLERLVSAGFDVERATYFFSPLFFAAAAVKLMRTVRAALRPGRADAERFDELVEARSPRALTAVMVKLLNLERPILRRWDEPLGTSILCIARAR
jgi:SAM-dependent methyltransferase